MQVGESTYDIHTAFGLVFITLGCYVMKSLYIYMTILNPYCSNPAKEAKINVNFHFNTSLENVEKVLSMP